jgi:G3E family GTPase
MLERLFFDRLHRKIPPFSWVLIETTGVADPMPIADLLQGSDIVASRYELAGVVTTFDVQHGLEQLQRHPEVRRQVECAAVVVLTKTDAANTGQIRGAREAIAHLNGGARLLTSCKGDLGAPELLAALRPAPSTEPAGEQGGEGDHHHHHAIHSEGVTTAFLPITSGVAWSILRHALSRSLAEHGGAILRLKGIVEIEGANRPQVIQASPPDLIERVPLDGNGDDRRLGLTIIAQGTPATEVARSLSAHMAESSRGPVPAELS